TRPSSSSTETGSAFGLVDSAPTSTRAAPASSITCAAAAASTAVPNEPPSEKLSGVTLTMPITDGRGQRSRNTELIAPTVPRGAAPAGERYEAAGSGGGCLVASHSGR